MKKKNSKNQVNVTVRVSLTAPGLALIIMILGPRGLDAVQHGLVDHPTSSHGADTRRPCTLSGAFSTEPDTEQFLDEHMVSSLEVVAKHRRDEHTRWSESQVSLSVCTKASDAFKPLTGMNRK